MLSKLLSPRTVGLAIAIVIGAATAAAAVTVPPGGRPSFAGPDKDTTTTTVAKSSVTTTATTEKPETETEANDDSQGTPASVTDPHAQFGLCNAWLHNSDEAKANSDVFKALAAAHGGAAGTTTYCQGIVNAKKSGHGHGNAGTHGKPSTSSGGDGSQSD